MWVIDEDLAIMDFDFFDLILLSNQYDGGNMARYLIVINSAIGKNNQVIVDMCPPCGNAIEWNNTRASWRLNAVGRKALAIIKLWSSIFSNSCILAASSQSSSILHEPS